MKLLYLQASPRKARSHCLAIADAFIEAWRKYHPGEIVVSRNVFEADLPAFDGEAVEARYLARRKEAGPEQAEAWGQVEELALEFKGYDRYVIASPMWNFSLPYRLKHYLDLIFQPGLTFAFPDSERAAAAAKKACFFLARGGEYPPDSPLDFQRPYLERIFGLLGLGPENMHWVLVEPTGGAPEQVKAMHTAKIAQALTIAKDF